MILRDAYTIADGHLWVVISDPNEAGEVAVVNLSHWEENRDQSCVIEKGEHEWVSKRSIVFYRESLVLSVAEQATVHRAARYYEAITAELLERILEGTDSDDCPAKVLKLARSTAKRLRADKKPSAQ